MFTKTWFSKNINSSELGLLNYSIFRCDRSIESSSLSRGGGVLIAINKQFISSYLNVDTGSLELLFVTIKINNTRKLIISCIMHIPSPKFRFFYVFRIFKRAFEKIRY